MHTVTMSNEKEKVYEYTEKTASEPPPNYDEAMAQAGKKYMKNSFILEW